MEPEGSSPHSQVPATGPYPEPARFSPYFLNIYLNIILPSTPGSPQWSLFLRFPHLNPVHASPLPHMSYMSRPSHSSRFITRPILCEEYRSLSSLLLVCSFLHSPVTSSLLGPNGNHLWIYFIFLPKIEYCYVVGGPDMVTLSVVFICLS